MADHKCKYCGNSYHWKNAFAKFGYDDGDGKIETPHIAQALENAGYSVKYSRWSPHNTLIYSIQKDGVEFMPLNNPEIRIGYDGPQTYLPQAIQAILNSELPPVVIFH